VPLGHLIAIQIALIAVVPFLTAPRTVLIAVASAAGFVILCCLVSIRGRWLWRWPVDYLAYRLRSRRVRAGDDQRWELLARLLPGAVLSEVEVDGEPGVAVLHPTGVVIVLQPFTSTEGVVVPAVALPSPAAFLPAVEAIPVPVSVQMVVATTPTTRANDRSSSAAEESYRTLTKGIVPRERRAFYAIRVCRDDIDRADADLMAMAVNVARRTVRRIRKQGLTLRVLTQDELLTAVAELAGLPWTPPEQPGMFGNPPDRGSRRLLVAKERWRAWSTGDLHATYRVRRWGRAGGPPWRLLDLMSALPTPTIIWSVTARREGASTDLECLIRVVADNRSGLRSVASTLTTAARSVKVGVQRMDGHHREGVAATVPIGGFLR
jgi:type VII secretion protein EccE